jgi:hypothetical protein
LEKEDLQAWYVNLHRKVFNTNLGLRSEDIKQMTIEQLEEAVACLKMWLQLRETHQTYIIDHDMPLSISKTLFELLDRRKKLEAMKRNVPQDQYEFEDIIGLFLGLGE